MNTKKILLCLLFLSAGLIVKAQTNGAKTIDTKAATKWVKSGKWKDGIKQNVYADVNAAEFYTQYHNNEALWKKVFAWLKAQNLDELAPGKYAFAGDSAFASVTDAPSREFEKSKWEAHRKYIDLQYVIMGAEKIGVIKESEAKVDVPYNEQKDNGNYISDGGKYYIAKPGTFYLFFPQDAHRPNIKVDGSDTVKKLVIKIRYFPQG